MKLLPIFLFYIIIEVINPIHATELLPEQSDFGAAIETTENQTIIIDKPGKYYLVEDHIVFNKAGILITASGVTLNLNNYGITGNQREQMQGKFTGIATAENVKNITIRNGYIKNFFYGIDVSKSSAITIDSLQFFGNMIGLKVGHDTSINNTMYRGNMSALRKIKNAKNVKIQKMKVISD